MSVIAMWSSLDVLTGVLIPIGVAAAKSPSLVIDLDPSGPEYPAPFTLADLVADGPTSAQLEPAGRGVSVLPNGGVQASDAADVVGALLSRWPNVVLRCDPRETRPDHAVPVWPLLPDAMGVRPAGPAVFQDLGLSTTAPRGSVVLPKPEPRVVDALAHMRAPTGRSRWLRALSSLWLLAR